MFKYSELDLSNIDPIVGTTYRNRAKEILKLLRISNVPIMLTGGSGTGKTITAKNIASRYAKKFNVPAYFIQLSPDQTKTNVILGLRLINGTLQVQNGVVAECMERGGIIIIDETTHATQSLLLMFNSLMDTDSVTSIGDKVIKAQDTFRIIFCCNDSSYSGNIKLPQSFCNRLIAYRFEYPSFDEEVEIAEQMLDNAGIESDNLFVKFFVSLMKDLRDKDIPLSVRNVYSAMLLLNIKKGSVQQSEIDKLIGQPNIEIKLKKLLSMALNIKIEDINKNDLLNQEDKIVEILSVGFDNINEIIKQSYLYYLDFDGSMIVANKFRSKLEGMLL